MLYKALKSFGGAVSMTEGEVKTISDILIVNDLVTAGYIEEAKPAKSKAKETATKKEK